MLSFAVKKQKLVRKDCQQVVTGSYNYLYASFSFSYDWQDLNINAIFSNSSSSMSMPIVDNICLVPWEIITSPNFTIALYGSTDEKRVTTNEVMIPVTQVNFNASDIPSPPPTPTDYEQYMEILRKYQDETNNQLEAISTNIQDLQNNKAQIVEETSYLNFPNIGNENNIYIDTSQNACYRWDSQSLKYYCYGSNYNDINIINGGSSNGF